MPNTSLTDNMLFRPVGLMISLYLLVAIVIFTTITSGILMTMPVVAAQLVSK